MVLTVERHTARPLRLIGRFVRRSWQGLLVAVLAVALGVAAFVSPGLVEADVVLDDGNVYVVKGDSELVGTLNSQIKQLSNASPLGDEDAEVLQNEDEVLIHLPRSGSLVPFDAARNISGSITQLPSNSTVQLVRDRLLVVGPEAGAAWSGSVTDMLAMDFEQNKPELEVGDGGTATLTTDGDVIGLDVAESRLVRSTPEGITTVALPFELEDDAVVSMSAVGEKAVVLDRSSRRIWVEGTGQALPVSDANTARLMAPAPDALGGEDGILAIYANSAGLNAVTKDGQESISSRIDLSPVAPIQVGRCVYGAGVSGTDGVFVRRCVGQEAQRETIESITSEDGSFSFQANRGVVTLNDRANGTVWMVDKDMFVIHPEDWDGVKPAEDDDPNNTSGSEVAQQPERSPDNRAPTANDDTLGARAGRSTVLNVLDNDSDPDGDVLTISTSSKLNGATLEPIRNGAGLQISIAANVAPGPLTFEYRVDDGRPGGTDTATVVVNVSPADMTVANTPPRLSEKPGGHKPVEVRSRTELTKRVLLDWRDPEGDPLILTNAWLEQDSEDILTFSPDGTIQFTDVGLASGRKKINLTVSDGLAETTGELLLNVGEDPVAPIAYGDYATTKVGSPVKVEPLANDQVYKPTLTRVAEQAEGCEECSVVADLREETITFTAQRPGTYYVPYDVQSGKTATGVVRIDVHGERVTGPPVAASDVALLPLGGTVVLDPLLNDTDPNGEVLVVQTFVAPESLQVVMERRHRMTISAKQDLTQPVQITYWISNGVHPVEGKITVVPTDIGSGTPATVEDHVRVRAGTTASINPVLNDTSPVGLDLSLGQLDDNTFGDRGWVDGDLVRISVPPGTAPGVKRIGYTVVDSRGGSAPGLIEVDVIAEDVPNTAPAPEPVVDRVLVGTETRIPIPLSGIDPNGDAVRLVGLASGPQLGRVTSVGEQYLTYEAFDGESGGTDTFTYQVVDAFGATGIGEVRVGVAPTSGSNTKPVAQRDQITVRPGRPVRLPALRNDFDADGDSIGYDADTPIEMDEGIEAEVVDHEIVMTAPAKVGTYVGTYAIRDGRGETAYGELIVDVEEDAENLPPVARDDSVPLSGIVDQTFVEVDPLANDFDPDGLNEDLRIEVGDQGSDGDGARVDETGRLLTVPVRAELQQIRYVLVDGDGARSNGLVVVPGTSNVVPALIEPGLELKPTAGQPMKIEVNRYVRGTAGRTVRLSGADQIWATSGADAGPQGEDAINYVADARFSGPAALVFEVQDKVSSPSDKTGRSAVISIPLDVLPAASISGSSNIKPGEELNQPPVATVSNPRLEVGAGEAERSLNLLSLFRDPDGDENSMIIKGGLQETGGDASIRWHSDREVLTASATVNAKPGSYKTVSGVVMDAEGAEVNFSVRVEVTSSTRPTITAKEDRIESAVAGQSYRLSVTANDKSHLLGDETITLLNVRATSPGGSVRIVNAATGEVEVTLEKGWHGPFTASYFVNDATGDPNRHVTGAIFAQVRDVPGTPSVPYSLDPEIRDGQVTVQYRSTGDGGARITGAVATATSSGQPEHKGTCAANTCTVTGLKNGVPWRISVVETNEVGSSQPSGLSAPQTPDARPNPPSQPTVAYADGQLTATWTHDPYSSPNGGSPIVGYDVTLSGGATATVTVGADKRTHTWTGLTNGTTYSFTVTARNQSGLTATSPASAPEYPSGVPTGDAAPVAKPVGDVGGAFNVTFSASGVDARGDAVKQWIVIPHTKSGRGDVTPRTVQADGSAAYSVNVTGMGLEPTMFTIEAVNRGPVRGQVGSTGAYQIAYPPPEITEASWFARNAAVGVNIATNLPAEAPVTYQYSLDGDNWSTFDGKQISGLTNGVSYTLRIRIELEGRVSATSRIPGAVPRSEAPPAPQVVARRLILPDRVQVDFDESLEATQGWGFANYRFCTGRRCGLSTEPVVVAAGQSTTVHWAAGSASGRYSENPSAVSLPTLDSSGTVGFTFPYVQSGSCTVVARGGEGQTTVSDIVGSDGVLTYRRTFNDIPIPDPPPEGPTTATATEATVTCTINQQTLTWELN